MNTTNTTFTTTEFPLALGTASIEKRYAASEAQLEVWLSSQQSQEANCAYNEISSLIFTGELDVDRLRQAVDHVVMRHESLRSTFSADGQDVLVHSYIAWGFEQIDCRQKDCRHNQPHDPRGCVDAVLKSQASTPFDLVQGPLLRLVLQRLADDQHKLTVTAHHLVMDGWSLGVFCNDLGHFYDLLGGADHRELPPADQYDDYAQAMENWLESDAGQADEAFWLDQFSDQIPVLDLPTQRSRPAIRTYNGQRHDHLLNPELVKGIRAVGAKSGCSLFNAMLAAFNAWVARISGSDDFCVGIPTAGQAALDKPELLGHCVNTMPLRTRVDVELPFVDYIKDCRNSLLDAFEHQRYSYGTLLRKMAPPRDPSRPPMLGVSFNVDPVLDTSAMGFSGLDVEIVIEPRRFENFEWFINGVIQQDQSIELQVQYNCDLFSEESIAAWFSGFETFLQEVVRCPDAAINQLHLMSIPQRQQVIVDWNATEMEYPVASTLPAEFSRQTMQTPDRVAVVFGDQQLTYREVETRSNQIARFLQTHHDVKAGDLVGICVERSADMLVNLFGIMKSGAGYVPLDPAYPGDRLQYMCDHSGLNLIVTQSELTSRVAEFNKPLVAIDDASEAIEQIDAGPLEVRCTPQDICYVIYTSGSTGKPKGVQVPHGAVVNFLYAMQQTPGFTADDSVLAVTTLSFDIAVLELYLPTISGGRVVIVNSLTAADGDKLAANLRTHDISMLQATPATWRLLIEADWQGKDDLKVLCGGEPMPQDLVAPLLDRCAELWNMYGPTETTVWSAAYRIENSDDPILIGKPIGNTQIYILDSNGREVPVGSEGEIFIGGAGVTLGYRNQPEMTEERFVANRYRNPFADYVSDRLYKTGDVGRYRSDGNLQFLRRNDKQVKVRGFRIELEEIEQNIKSHPAVAQNVVIVREDTPGDTRLAAYLIVKPGQTVTAAQLRDHLRESVPYYMVPQNFVQLEKMPQTNNGKIDYKALPAPTESADGQRENHNVSGEHDEDMPMPATAAEQYLAGVWQSVLAIDDVTLYDTFFDIGGHSLLAMKVIAQVKEKTGVAIGPQEFLMSTLEQMADRLSEAFPEADTTAEVGEEAGQESAFEEPAETESAENPDNVAQTNNAQATPDAKANSEKPPSAFRRLTGFWSEG